MLSPENKETIKSLVEEFLGRTALGVVIKRVDLASDPPRFDLETDLPSLLIGEQGQTLFDLQRLLNLVLRKKIGFEARVEVDINDYKAKKISYLEELARSAADAVALNKTEKELPFLTAWERRVIHLALINRSDVLTESRGEGEERRLVVRPRS